MLDKLCVMPFRKVKKIQLTLPENGYNCVRNFEGEGDVWAFSGNNYGKAFKSSGS